MPAPLEGIRVLDFTRYQNGPHATVMLSDMGADILKVEAPDEGDPGRSLGRRPDGFCAYFEGHDRGKRSITLNLRKPEAREIVHRLVEQTDVVTENFRPGFLDKLGLGYDELREVNPRLIYATNSGFGPKGPWRERGSFDIVAQGMGGIMVAQGGGPGLEPQNIRIGVADQVGSMIFAYGIMAALVARERYGVGQKLDVSQLGAMMTLQASMMTGFLHTRVQPQRRGRAYNPTFGHYQAGDQQWLTVGVLDPKHWPRMCNALGRADLIDDERTATAAARVQNADWLMDELVRTFLQQPRDVWIEALVAQDVPCGPVYDYAGVAAEPQFWENGYLVDVPHAQFGTIGMVGIPVQLSETPGRVQGPAPELGQHTEEVLLRLGYTWEQMEALRIDGVI
ncbi:MAG: CoA transferase [Chloroflexi bacterium]|nr:CoA transferase [Chloroflexota bacterium]